MSIYDIHFCSFGELPELQSFIDKYWRKNHIMTYSKLLFEFQHKIEGQDHYTFVIAKNVESNEIDGVYGYIETNKYDNTHSIPNIGWGAIWKVRDDIFNKEIGKLGLKMLKFILKNSTIETFAALGISSIHKKIALSLNFKVGTINHYYIVNNNLKEYSIIVNPLKKEITKANKYVSIEICKDISKFTVPSGLNPFKNVSYFINRYQKHPIFNYEFWVVYHNDVPLLIFSVRKISINNSCIYRIIDMIGNLPSNISLLSEIQQILIRNNAEYIDCLNYGIQMEFFTNIGFTLKSPNGDTIVPDHLDPLEHKNIPLEFDCMDDIGLVIFKGDGDQDRPNKL